MDEKVLDELKSKISQGHVTSIKKILKIFTICFNEKQLKSSKYDYEISKKSIMIEVLDVFLLDTSE